MAISYFPKRSRFRALAPRYVVHSYRLLAVPPLNSNHHFSIKVPVYGSEHSLHQIAVFTNSERKDGFFISRFSEFSRLLILTRKPPSCPTIFSHLTRIASQNYSGAILSTSTKCFSTIVLTLGAGQTQNCKMSDGVLNW